MRVVYGVQFETRPPEGTPNEDVPSIVRKKVADWVADWYKVRRSMDIVFPIDGGTLTPLEAHQVKVLRQAASFGESLWSCEWAYPSDEEPNLLWQSQCLVAHSVGQTEVSFLLRLAVKEFQIRSVHFDVRRPRLIKGLVDDLPCYLGGRRVQSTPRLLSATDVDSFVEQTLLSPDRRLPAVVVSQDAYTGLYSVDPLGMADRLAGLAEVYYFANKWVSFGLSDRLSGRLSCYNGAVRIYWPGFRRDSDPFDHPLFTPQRILRLREAGQDIGDVVFRRLVAISAIQITEGPITQRSRARIAGEEHAKRQALIAEITSGRADKERLQTEVASVLEQVTKLQEEKEQLQALVESVTAELDEQKRLWADYGKLVRAEDEAVAAEQAVEEEGAEREFTGVRAALDQAASDFAGQLIVLESAEESADDSRFRDPAQVYNGLEAIAEVAKKYFQTKATSKSMGPWEDVFRSLGFEYAARDSQTTATKYREQRTFTYEGKTVTMSKHITLGGGSRENCLQIYFDVDELAKRFVIGYCGKHLDYARMRT